MNDWAGTNCHPRLPSTKQNYTKQNLNKAKLNKTKEGNTKHNKRRRKVEVYVDRHTHIHTRAVRQLNGTTTPYLTQS
jgi:hypothetical protein